MPPQEPPPADAAPGPPPPGAEAIRRALRGPPGRVALRLAPPADAARRRVAIALLQEAGAPRGGAVLEAADGALLLTEAAPAEAMRAEAVLARLLGTAPERLALPEGLAALGAGFAPPVPPPPPPPAAGIEALADAAPLPALVRREPVLHIAPGAPRRLALLRLRLAPAALAPHLGAAAADEDLARHARERLRARLLAELPDATRREELLGLAPPVPLLIDLPASLLPAPPDGEAAEAEAPPALLAVLPRREALREDLPARRPALRRAGWGIALRGLDAAALALLAPEALPADLLLLDWSAELAGRAATGALRRADPARLALMGCDGPAALEWGLALGITRYAGPWIEALAAATRMAACAHAGACTRDACAARAAAAEPAGREGCADRLLLGAVLPA